jgi:haloacetate dehalogenase
MSHITWHKIAPELQKYFHIIAADLRGYGNSIGPEAGGNNHINYSFRAMAADQIAIMEKFGFTKFQVAGHDRGARTVHRMCLDHKDRIQKAAILDIMPNRHIWTVQKKDWAKSKWHWLLMMQPYDLPERMLSSVPADFYLEKKMSKRGGGLDFCRETFQEYVKCFNLKTIKASCEDYRASPTCDLDMDNLDFENQNKIDCPTLVLWGAKSDTGIVWGDVVNVWKNYCSKEVKGFAVEDSGHYIQEEKPKETIDHFMNFFDR